MRIRTFFAIAALGLALSFQAAAQAPGPDTLVVAQSVDANTLDPADVSSRNTANILQHVFGTLVKVTAEGEIVPNMADSWTVSPDGKEITFRLKRGLTCHDGEAFTALDAAYSFNRAKDPAFGFTGNTPGFVYASIAFQEARADSDLDVTIVMGSRRAIALGLIGEVYLHCQGSYEGLSKEQAANTAIGTGPYRFIEWIKDDRIVIERVDGHPLGDPFFKRVVWRVIPEASTRSAELMAGNVDIIANVSPDQIATINNSGRAAVQAVAGTRRIYVGFNLRDDYATGSAGGAAIQNTLVRQALNYAVDVPTICAQLLGTDCDRATGLVNPPNDNPNLAPYAFDPEKAEALLDQAGYPRGANGVRFSIKFQAPRGRYLNDANVALAVGQYLTDVGVETEVELLEWASVYVPLIRQKSVGPLFLLGSGGATWNAQYDMADLSTVAAGTNYTSWSNPNWFSGWDKLAATTDPAQERAIINDMLAVFYNDPPWLMMYFQPDFYGASNRLDWQARRDEKIYIDEARLR
jgi:peptide/nickel transport system substrate-binding protein